MVVLAAAAVATVIGSAGTPRIIASLLARTFPFVSVAYHSVDRSSALRAAVLSRTRANE